MNSRRLLIAAGFVVMWSSGFIGADLGTNDAAPLTLLAWRFGLIAALLTPWLWARRHIHAHQLWRHIVIGLFTQAGYLYGVVAAADAGVPAGTSALIAAFQPVVATVASSLLLNQAATCRHWMGLAIGLAGTVIVMIGDLGGDAPAWAYLLPLAAMASLVAGTLISTQRRGTQPVPLTTALAVQCTASAVVFVSLAIWQGQVVPPAQPLFWVAVLWVIVLSTLGGYGFYWLAVQHFGIARSATLLYVTPPVSALWAAIMLGQPVTAVTVVGMLVSAAGIAIVLAQRTNLNAAKHIDKAPP